MNLVILVLDIYLTKKSSRSKRPSIHESAYFRAINIIAKLEATYIATYMAMVG